MLVDRKYFLLIEKKPYLYNLTIIQGRYSCQLKHTNVHSSIILSTDIWICEHASVELIPLQLKRLKSAKIYIKIDLLHLKRLQLWSLFPLTQPMHVQNLIKTLTLIAKWSYVSINTTQTSCIHDVTLTSLTVLWTSWWTSYSIISCCRTS